jgi:pimeloyl-ACP methyl ester carboxylesterase
MSITHGGQVEERALMEGVDVPSSSRVRFLGAIGDGWRRRTTAVVVLAGVAALIAAWLTPRGPITTVEALVSMAAALGVGVAAGVLLANRWSIVVAPAAFVAVFELARMGIEGPTVDSIEFGGTYGIIALIVGRVFHGLLVLVPVMLGASYGVWWAGRTGRASRIMGAFGRTVTGLVTVAVVAVAFLLALPASTAPIVGSDGETPPGSIAELVSVEIGGHPQAMLIRGRSVDNPVLLYLAGGPGGTDLGAIRRDVGLEQDFTVVAWDQRGAGKSYNALDPTETFTLDQMVADTLEVTNYLRDRFDVDKIYLVGQSWGSTLGVLAAQQRPELYEAFVGVGQMVSQRVTDQMFWEDTLAWAESNANVALAETMRSNGPPPYTNLIEYDPVIAYEHDWNVYSEFDPNTEMPAILFVPEYNWMDRMNAFRGFLDTVGILYPQLQDIDFRNDVATLEIPMYMVQGEHEARGRAVLAEEWFQMLEAPTKEVIVIPGGGHRAHFDQPAMFADIMRRVRDAA